MITVIVAGGSLDLGFARAFFKEHAHEEKFIIACDKGFGHCLDLDIRPDYCIGDFDSAGEKLYKLACDMGLSVTKLNPIKDDTDGEASVHLALEKGQGDIYILGGTGSRLDHVAGNIALLSGANYLGRRIFLIDPTNKIYMLSPGSRLTILKSNQHGRYVSLFPHMGQVTGLCLKGFKYCLTDAVLTGFNTLTVSNEIVDDEAFISFDTGYLLVMETCD